jgi:phosphatidylglycerol lysyltransferase
MEYFELPGTGVIAYMGLGGRHGVVALGDPLAARTDCARIAEAFMRDHPRCCFLQTSRACADALAGLGLCCNKMGDEVVLPLQSWSLTGKAKQNLRTTLNRAAREGITAEELASREPVADQLRDVNQRWLKQTAPGGELRLMTRPAVFTDEPGVRQWVARDSQGGLLAFVYLDPQYSGGQVVSYSANVLRGVDSGPASWRDLLILAAARQLRSEGVPALNLGIAPFADTVTEAALHPSSFTHWCFWSNYHWHNWLYNFRGIASHKLRYGGRLHPVYFCTRRAVPLGQLLAVLRACGIDAWRRLLGSG